MRALIASAVVSLLLAAPVAAQTYDPTLVPGQIIGAPTTMTPLQLNDDNTVKIDLGFEFIYWGQTFTSAWVSSNGFVSFSTSSNLCCDGQPLANAPRNTIYGLWTDLVSYSGNPYYQQGNNSILFGWYGTTEYGTQNQFTFEIGLTKDGTIRINYGNLAPLSYHTATAGITGPGAEDNILFFYGRDPRAMQNQSGVLSWAAPKVAVDCTVTPLDPSCPPPTVTAIQTGTIETIQDAYAADVQADQSEIAAATISEPAQEIDIAVPVEASQTETAKVQVPEAAPAERLTPDQVAALAAAPAPEVMLPSTGILIQLGPTQTSASSSVPASTFEAATSSSSPSSPANVLEALNMASAPMSMATAQSEQTANTMAEGQGETIAAIAAVPGFSAYSQVSLRDRPDFYAIRKIYTRAKIDDAYIKLYRMTASSDATWAEMVEDQYE